MAQDWFTKHALAKGLHICADEALKRIERGCCRECKTVGTSGLDQWTQNTTDD